MGFVVSLSFYFFEELVLQGTKGRENLTLYSLKFQKALVFTLHLFPSGKESRYWVKCLNVKTKIPPKQEMKKDKSREYLSGKMGLLWSLSFYKIVWGNKGFRHFLFSEFCGCCCCCFWFVSNNKQTEAGYQQYHWVKTYAFSLPIHPLTASHRVLLLCPHCRYWDYGWVRQTPPHPCSAWHLHGSGCDIAVSIVLFN